MGTVERQSINQKAQAVMKGIKMVNKTLLNHLHATNFGRKTDDQQAVAKEILWNDGADYDDIEWDDTFDQYWDEVYGIASHEYFQF